MGWARELRGGACHAEARRAEASAPPLLAKASQCAVGQAVTLSHGHAREARGTEQQSSSPRGDRDVEC